MPYCVSESITSPDIFGVGTFGGFIMTHTTHFTPPPSLTS